MPKLQKELLGLAGEYAVASELCRRGLYAQLTLGHHKSTDILVETELKMLRIQVKAKQGSEWPSIAGLYRSDDFLVLVDFLGRALSERPSFYILDCGDWKDLVIKEQILRPTITVNDQLQVTHADGWRGLNIKPKQVIGFEDEWQKILDHMNYHASPSGESIKQNM